jgi:hypothetical protein
MRGPRICRRCDRRGYRNGSTDHPTSRRGETDGPRADPGPLEEAVGEREDRSAHEALGGVAKQEDLTFARMSFETAVIDHDTNAINAHCTEAFPI